MPDEIHEGDTFSIQFGEDLWMECEHCGSRSLTHKENPCSEAFEAYGLPGKATIYCAKCGKYLTEVDYSHENNL